MTTTRLHIIGVWVAVAALAATVLVIGISLTREHGELGAISERLDIMEEESLAFPGSATWQWRQHIDQAIGRVEMTMLQALRLPSGTPTRATVSRTPTAAPRRTPTLSPDMALITTPYLLGVTIEILRGVEKDHPSWSPQLKRRYAAAAVAQYLSVHGAIPSAATVNRLLDEATAQLRAQRTPEKERP